MTVLIIFAVLLVSIIIVSNVIEYADYNHGVCPLCGEELAYLGTGGGSRVYGCSHCVYYTYVSWHWIDVGRHKKK